MHVMVPQPYRFPFAFLYRYSNSTIIPAFESNSATIPNLKELVNHGLGGGGGAFVVCKASFRIAVNNTVGMAISMECSPAA
jgi:hypothetical protein